MTFDARRAAELLIAARRDVSQTTLPKPPPASASDAYAVQKIVAETFGPARGWKVGAKARSETPKTSPLFADIVRPAPAEWPAASLHMIGIEAELAFRLGRDIPVSDAPVAPGEVWNAIASVHAAIEIVDTRVADWKNVDPLWLIADNQMNGGFVFAPDGVAIAAGSYADAAAKLTIDDAVAVERRGGNPAGDPRWLVEWCVDHVVRQRGGLTAGDFITTGSYTGMIFVPPGTRVTADFAGIGTVSVGFPV